MRKLVQAVTAVAALGLALFGCTGGGNGSSSTLAGQILAPSFKSAPSADLSGQQSVFQGDLGHGTTFTFAAIKGATYYFQVGTQNNDDLIIDVFSRDGSELKGKEFTGGTAYFHDAASQHVLCLLRPGSVFNSSVTVTSLTVLGTGNYSQNNLAVNIIVAGDDFSGFGAYNDLATTQDRQNLAADLAKRFQALHDANNTGIKLAFEGFTLTTAQVKATHPELVDGNSHTICRTQPESLNSQGSSNIDTADLDRWGDFGFPANSSDTQAANALDVFIVHHFATDGVVGLSPRPGTTIQGNGPGSALCIGAFLQVGGQIQGPRDLGNMGVVMTHEIGHFLGLQHTTTFSPASGTGQVTDEIDDGLGDTPSAGTLSTLISNANARGDATIGIGDGCADENYIMFYESIPTQTQFSPKQVTIMKTTLSVMPH